MELAQAHFEPSTWGAAEGVENTCRVTIGPNKMTLRRVGDNMETRRRWYLVTTHQDLSTYFSSVRKDGRHTVQRVTATIPEHEEANSDSCAQRATASRPWRAKVKLDTCAQLPEAGS